ncbi:MAG: hypothetical protein CMO80_02260 [Verrucomicrobiales bacterium]|nr:hypothetical protein [Verrucomicrobiales bacterium]|tara:strand:+ start:4324 stop:5079 length:756 start_codon:yes stop_codon:yes gene_type:complete
MQIHINRDGQDYGPYTIEQVNQYLLDGSVIPTDMAWHDGLPDWVPLPQVSGVVIPGGGAAVVTATGAGSKKMIIGISVAALAAAAVAGGLVYVAMTKNSGGDQASAGDGGGESSQTSIGSSASGSGGNGGNGMNNGMGMDGDMEMGMGMDMDGMDGMAGGGGASFAKVKAIFKNKCYKCHGNGKSKGGYTIDSKSGAMDAITVGRPDASLLVRLVRRDDPDDAMPPKESDKLSPAEVAAVVAWVKAGAKWQ